MIPTVGRMVHFTALSRITSGEPVSMAAIITAVKLHNQFYGGQPPPDSEENKYCVSLHVFHQTGQFDVLQVTWYEKSALGYWNWPPKV